MLVPMWRDVFLLLAKQSEVEAAPNLERTFARSGTASLGIGNQRTLLDRLGWSTNMKRSTTMPTPLPSSQLSALSTVTGFPCSEERARTRLVHLLMQRS
jgi:hypothetical protein